MNKQTLFNKFVTVPFLIVALAICGCKKDDSEDDDGSGAGGGGGGGGGGSGQTTGGSIIFDGSGEHLLTTRTWYTGDFTICLWMNPSNITGNTLLSMSATDKYFFLSFNETEISWNFESSNDSDSVITASHSFSAYTKYHVCVTGDHDTAGNAGDQNNSRAAIFVNGARIGTSSTSLDGVASALSSTLSIGYEPTPNFQAGTNNKSNPFAGSLDNLIIWSYELSTAAIGQIYASGSSFDPNFAYSNYTVNHTSNLKVWYQMGEHAGDSLSGSGALIHDYTGNEDATPVDFESNDFGPSL